ncbi:MAG TPA: M23 family metallopeptidase [Candidatus Limnocylindrales bacterium]|nr:M23 family metallopeptidase [Candidatus Limnocylindrales bacterium]
MRGRREASERVAIIAHGRLDIRRLAILMAHAGAATLLFPSLSAAQKKSIPARDCSAGVSLAMAAATGTQGGLLRLYVRSITAIRDLKGEWVGGAIPFWPDAKIKNLEHGLLGIDLERAPGKYNFTIETALVNGNTAKCTVEVTVKAGNFAVEKLTVAKEYAEPGPEDVARADKEQQRLREIFATVTPEKLWQGRFRLPLVGTHPAKNFGRRRVLNGNPGSPHTGMDFPAAAGTPIHAAQAGRVVLAEDLFFSGNTVVVDHGLGIYTFYGHMEKIDVAVGDAVKAGTVLGLVGATGRVTGPHLHWALKVDTARVNPLQIVGVQ